MRNINIWSEIGGIFRGLFDRLLQGTETLVTEYLPGLVPAAVTLVVGWMVAVFLRRLATKGLKAVGFDLVLRRTGVQPFLERRGVAVPPSRMVGWALYAVVLYSALLMAFQRVEFETGMVLLTVIARMVPRLIVVVVLLGVGNLLGRWLGEMMQRAARVADIPWSQLIGATVRAAILVFVGLISIRYLGLASDQLLLTGIAIIAVAFLLAGFLVAFCARELVLNALAAKVYRNNYQPGDRIKIGDREGDVVSVGPASVRLRTGTGFVQIPAALLTREIVEHRPNADSVRNEEL